MSLETRFEKRQSKTGVSLHQCIRIVCIAVQTVLQLAMVGTAVAQSEKHVHTLAFQGVPLAAALEYVIDETRIDLVYASALVEGRSTFCKIERADAEAVLACVLEGTGVDFVRLSSGTYVLIEDVETVPARAALVGQIVDAETGSPVAGANVFVADSGSGTATNTDGRFAVAGLLPGTHRVLVSHVGYQARIDSVALAAGRSNHVSIPVEPRVIHSAPIIVTGDAAVGARDVSKLDRRSASEIEEPEGVGSPDVIQNVGTVAGVRLGDAGSEVHIQGGSSNEHQFLLDGVPLFVPVSSGGFVGPFSPFAIEQLTIRKAGFGADHGSHLSGVIELEHHLGSETPYGLMVQADPLSTNARWDARKRLPDEKEIVWMIAGRRSMWDTYHPPQMEDLFQSRSRPDLFLKNVLESPEERPVRAPSPKTEDGKLEVGFTDLHGAVRLRLGGLRSLKLAFYRGANTFGIDEVRLPQGAELIELEDAYRWSNRAANLRYEWVASGHLLMSAETWFSGYELEHPVSSLATETVGGLPGTAETSISAIRDDFNAIQEVGVRARGDLALSGSQFLSGAVEVAHTGSEFKLSLDPFGRGPSGPDVVQPMRWRLSGFVTDRVSLWRHAAAEVGTRITYLPAQRVVLAEPRMSLDYQRDRWSARGAVGLYRQFLHSFDVTTFNIASLLPRVRFWLPVGREQRTPEAYHASLSITYEPVERLALRGQAYYKHLPHTFVLNYGAEEGSSADRLFRRADGYAYGFATSAAIEGRRVELGLSYEYGLSKRRIPGRFDSRFLPTPWNAPHRVSATLDLMPQPAWSLSARWQAVYGRTWGYRQAYYDFLVPDPASVAFGAVDLSDPEAHRLPAKTQLDLGMAYRRDVGRFVTEVRVSLVNVAGRRNVTDWSLRYDESEHRYVQEPRRGVPFLPVVSLRVTM